MGRTNSPRYSFWIHLRFGELMASDPYGHRDPPPAVLRSNIDVPYTGPRLTSPRVVRLDPAAVGKAIHAHAVPGLMFRGTFLQNLVC